MEGILGLRIEADAVHIAPCLPKAWGGYEAELAGRAGSLVVRVHDPEKLGSGAVELFVDGVPREGDEVERGGAEGTRPVDVTLKLAL